jgi:MFS transporter, DHA1 family, multidrug resistance protein
LGGVVIIGAIGMATSVIILRFLSETLRRRPALPIAISRPLQSYRSFASNRGFVANLGIVALSYAGLFGWISSSPFVLQDLYGLSPFEFGIAFAAACMGSLIAATIAASLVMRIGIDRTIGLGASALAVGGVGMIACLLFGSPPVALLVLAMAFYNAGLLRCRRRLHLQ